MYISRTIFEVLFLLLFFILWPSFVWGRSLEAINHYRAGQSYLSKEQWEKALEEFKQAIQNDYYYLDARLGVCISLLNLKRTEEAVKELNDIININEQYSLAYFYLGIVYYNKKDFPRALHYFNQTIKYDKSYTPAYYSKGVVLYRTGKLEDAIQQWKIAVSYNKEDYNSYGNLGVAYYNQGRTEEALEILEMLAKKYPQNPVPLFNLAWIKWRQGEVDKAKELWQKIAQLDNTSLALSAQALNALVSDNLREAEELSAKALQEDPQLDSMYYLRGLLEKKKGNFSSAQNYFQQALEIDPNSKDYLEAMEQNYINR